MANFALAVVPADWDSATPLTFSQAQMEAIRDKVESGTQLILYRSAPADEVIGQANAHGLFIKTNEWPQENLGKIDPSDPEQAWILPIDVILLLSGPSAPVPLSRVREILHDAGFPHPGELWRVLTPGEYDTLRDGWT